MGEIRKNPYKSFPSYLKKRYGFKYKNKDFNHNKLFNVIFILIMFILANTIENNKIIESWLFIIKIFKILMHLNDFQLLIILLRKIVYLITKN